MSSGISADPPRTSGPGPAAAPFEVEAPEIPGLAHTLLRERFAPNSQLALRADWRVWRAWCARQVPVRSAFPATPVDLRGFIADCSPPVARERSGGVRVVTDADEAIGGSGRMRAASTLVRYLSSIGVVHRLAGLADPAKDPLVASARRLYTRGRMASVQKAPLGLALVRAIAATLEPERTLWNRRAAALLWTAHSTMARRAELVALCVEDLASTPTGEGVAHLRRTKTDPEGRGSERYLAAPAVAAIRAWLEAARIEAGPIFRRLRVGGGIGSRAVSAHEVARIFKVAAARYAATLSETERRRVLPSIRRIAAHSTRIGAAQDLVASGADLVAVMQAGGWKDTGMPALYTRRLSALRGGMAKLYKAEASHSANSIASNEGLLPDASSERTATSASREADQLTILGTLGSDVDPQSPVSISEA